MAVVGQAPGPGPQAPGGELGASTEAQGQGPGASEVLFTCEAAVEGEIAPEPRGSNGFGYDPIFFYPPYGKTLGEVSDVQKLAVAHRGKAFAQVRTWIERELSRP